MAVKHWASPRVEGATTGLAVVALAAVFSFAVFAGTRTVEAVKAAPDPLRAWGTQRVISELGEYDQRVDCADLGLQGLTGYVWLDAGHRRVIFLCKE